LLRLRDNLDRPVEEIFTSHAPTPQVPRIAIRSSTFGGLLLFPTRAAKTVVIFKIGKAAAKTQDLLFTFSTGSLETTGDTSKPDAHVAVAWRPYGPLPAS
jgi:hypothetical protein